MPPLYRMPVFYLAVLVLTAALGAGALTRSVGSRAVSPATIEAASAPAAPQPAKEVTQEQETTAADGILRTRDGLRRKVVVKDLDVVCRSEPGGGRRVGPPLDYFAIRYVF